jgi:hypothetical protein
MGGSAPETIHQPRDRLKGQPYFPDCASSCFVRPIAAERGHRGQRNTLLEYQEILERAKGFEPSTPTLARSCSTPELHPHPFG